MESADPKPVSPWAPPQLHASLRPFFRWIALAGVGVVVCAAIGYAVGTQAAANWAFAVWAFLTGAPTTVYFLRYNDWKKPGAVPAFVLWLLWFSTTLVLGFVVFGGHCPLARVNPLGLPGLR
jgi:hypothetical protein